LFDSIRYGFEFKGRRKKRRPPAEIAKDTEEKKESRAEDAEKKRLDMINKIRKDKNKIENKKYQYRWGHMELLLSSILNFMKVALNPVPNSPIQKLRRRGTKQEK